MKLKLLNFKWLFTILLFFLFSNPSWSQELPVVNIGIVLDGPWDMNEEVISLFKQEVIELTKNEFDVQFPQNKMLISDWTPVSIRNSIKQLLEDPQVDILLGGGVITSQEIGKFNSLSKPVIAPVVLDPELQGFPLVDGRSGFKNLCYIHSPERISNEIRYFLEIVPFRKLTILASQAFSESIPLFNQRIEELGHDLGIETHTIQVKDNAGEVLEQIPGDAEAVFVGTLFQLSEAEYQILVDGLIEKKLPSFALWGRADVERGVLAGLLPENYLPRLARRVALNVQRILLGQKPEDIPVAFAPEDRLVINLSTARKIGVYPSWAILTEAELLNPIREDVRRALGLRDAMLEALEMNLDLAVSNRRITAGEKEISIARSDLLPQLNISGLGLQIDKDRAEASFGSQAERTLSGSLQATQVIYSEPALANLSIQKSLQKSRMYENDALRLDVIEEAAVAYLDVLRTKTFERIQRENLKRTRENLELAEVRLSIGISGPSDVYRWQSQIATNRRNVIYANSQRNLAEIGLNRILNRPLEESFETKETDLSDAALIDKFNRLFKYMNNLRDFKLLRNFMVEEGISHSPEIMTIDAAMAAQKRFLKLTKNNLWMPTLALQGEVTHRFSQKGAGSPSDPGVALPPGVGIEFPRRDDTDWSIALNASLDIIRGGAKLAEKQQALEVLLQLQTERSALVHRIEQRVRSSFHLAGASFAAIQQSRMAAEASKNNLELVVDSYSQGALSIIELLDAQNAALVSEEAASNAVYDFLIDLIRVQRAIGKFDILQTDRERNDFYDRLDNYFNKMNEIR
ncbi:MAG: TolC family protein [bacterium]|nr:MAG: TolC family protein [bacterium]